MRILSLLPAATEIVYLLGLEKYLVGVSSDCDFPSEVKKIPKITSSVISNKMGSLEIDRLVGKSVHKGSGIFHIDQQKLEQLKPDLILTQELCEVCAIGFTAVKKASRILDGKVKIVSLEPESVDDILENIQLVGEVTNRLLVARKLVTRLKTRIKKLVNRNEKTSKRPKVLVIEWLDPVMVAGHWVPEMVEIAGGEMLITKRGERSRHLGFREFGDIRPFDFAQGKGIDILIIAPCGFDIDRIIKEKLIIYNLQCTIKAKKIYLMDGNAFLTRPGPRIVDGVEILAEILHPELFKRRHGEKDWVKLSNK